MIELDRIIETVGIDTEVGFHIDVTNRIINKNIAKIYLEKYFLEEADYFSQWKAIEDSIFQNKKEGLPKLIFKEGYRMIMARGGTLFEERDFKVLKECCLKMGDRNLIVIQNDFDGEITDPIFRMKYPVDISWEEMMSGNFISTALFEMPYNEYFVFSESGMWGKYSANDYENPLDIIGFKPEVELAFEKYKEMIEEDEDISDWIPDEYRSKY